MLADCLRHWKIIFIALSRVIAKSSKYIALFSLLYLLISRPYGVYNVGSDADLATGISSINITPGQNTLNFNPTPPGFTLSTNSAAFNTEKNEIFLTATGNHIINLANYSLFSGSVNLTKTGANTLVFRLPGTIPIAPETVLSAQKILKIQDTGGIEIGGTSVGPWTLVNPAWSADLNNPLPAEVNLHLKDTAQFILRAGNNGGATGYNLSQSFAVIHSQKDTKIDLKRDANNKHVFLKVNYGDIVGSIDSDDSGNKLYKMNHSNQDYNKLRLCGTNATTARFDLIHEGGVVELHSAQALGAGGNSVPIDFALTLNPKTILVTHAIQNHTSFALQNDNFVTFDTRENFDTQGGFTGGGTNAIFTKKGPARLSIGQPSSANLYTGLAHVEQGTLSINKASVFNNLDVNVKSQGTLAGAGTIKSAVVNGKLLVGDSTAAIPLYTEVFKIDDLIARDRIHIGFLCNKIQSTKLELVNFQIDGKLILDFHFPPGVGDIDGVTFNNFISTVNYKNANGNPISASSGDIINKFYVRIPDKDLFYFYPKLDISNHGHDFQLKISSFDINQDFKDVPNGKSFIQYVYENFQERLQENPNDLEIVDHMFALKDAIFQADVKDQNQMVEQFDGGILRTTSEQATFANQIVLGPLANHILDHINPEVDANDDYINNQFEYRFFQNSFRPGYIGQSLGRKSNRLKLNHAVGAKPMYIFRSNASSNYVQPSSFDNSSEYDGVNLPDESIYRPADLPHQLPDDSVCKPAEYPNGMPPGNTGGLTFNSLFRGEQAIWIQPVIGRDRVRLGKNLPNAYTDKYGFIIGYDNVNPTAVIGFSLSHMQNDTLVENQMGRSDIGIYGASIYGGYQFRPKISFDSSLTINHTVQKGFRNVSINGAMEAATSKWTSLGGTIHMGFQYMLKQRKTTALPYISLDYNFVEHGSFHEGSLSYTNLHLVKERFRTHSLIPKIGITFTKLLTHENGIWIPRFNVSLKTTIPFMKQPWTARLSGFNETFNRDLFPKANLEISPSAGLQYLRRSGLFFNVSYQGNWSAKILTHDFMFKIGKRF